MSLIYFTVYSSVFGEYRSQLRWVAGEMATVPMTSALAKKTINDVVAEGDTPTFSKDKVVALRLALQGYSSTDSVRSFGATVSTLKPLAWSLCKHDQTDDDIAKTVYGQLIAAPVSKRELAARVLRLLNEKFPVADSGTTSEGRPVTSLTLQPGELELVREFLSARRKSGPAQEPGDNNTEGATVTTPVDAASVGAASVGTGSVGPRVTFDATGPTVIPTTQTATGMTWSSLLSSAGVSAQKSVNAPSAGLTFWCPLMEDRRGSYMRGPEALAADCSRQVRLVKSWPRPPHPDTVRKVDDIRGVLPILAQAGGVMPALPLHEDVLRLYQFLLEQRATRAREEAASRPALTSGAPVGSSSTGTFGSLSAMAPVRPGLDSVASARFANAATGQLSELSSSVHVDQCVHIMEQYTAHKNAPAPKPVIPMSVRVYIQQTMAPADSRVTDAYSIVRGSGPAADARRDEVKDIMVQIFEKANDVAFERVHRGTVVDREKRRCLGQELSKQQRQISLQRESHALAKLRVLARCLVLGQTAVLALRSAQTLPQFAQDLIKLQPHLTVAQAISQAKSMLKAAPTPSREGIRVERVDKKRPAPSPASAPQRVVIQIQRQGGSGSQSTGRPVEGQPNKRRRNSNRRRCYWCGSKKHILSDCPAKKQGLPKTQKPKKE